MPSVLANTHLLASCSTDLAKSFEQEQLARTSTSEGPRVALADALVSFAMRNIAAFHEKGDLLDVSAEEYYE